MTCKTTHHHACDCREAKLAKLVEALEDIAKLSDDTFTSWMLIATYRRDTARKAIAEFRGEK